MLDRLNLSISRRCIRALGSTFKYCPTSFGNGGSKITCATYNFVANGPSRRKMSKFDDVVLLKDADTVRYEWPMGVIMRTFPGKDGKVRQVELRVVKNGKLVVFVLPITEIVQLFSP